MSLPCQYGQSCLVVNFFKSIVARTHNKKIKEVKVEIIGASVFDNTSASGRFTVKPAAAGTYSIKLSKPGLQDKTVSNIVVQLGQPADAGTIAMTA